MMMKQLALLVLASAAMVQCQRPPYAGSKPIGYPVFTTVPAADLADRFGEVNSTTQRIPIEANGDRDLVDRLSKLPIDKQPFWLINWQALEAQREHPQTFPQKPNTFVDPPQHSGHSGSTSNGNTNSGNLGNSGTGNNGIPNRGNLNSGIVGNSDSGINVIPNRGNLDFGNLGNSDSGISGTPNRGNFAPLSGSNTKVNSNRKPGAGINSANRNSAVSSSANNNGALADRFGGIELNQFY